MRLSTLTRLLSASAGIAGCALLAGCGHREHRTVEERHVEVRSEHHPGYEEREVTVEKERHDRHHDEDEHHERHEHDRDRDRDHDHD